MKPEPEFDKYLKRLITKTDVQVNDVEDVLLTQVALVLSDFAVKKKSQCFFGELNFDGKNVTITLNDFIINALKGKVDPMTLLSKLLK